MLRRTLFLFFLALFSLSAVYAEDFSEGIEYDKLKNPVTTSNPDKVVVTEVFWYGCPHCFRLEPYMVKWKETLPDGVELEIVPSVLNRNWANHARAYYALQMMGADEQMHARIFNAIHLRNQRLDTAESLADFVAKQGLDEKQFLDYFGSFPVDSKLRKNRQIERKYGHRGVPAIIVNGKYLTSASRAGSNAQMLKVVDYLIQQELAQR
ncbi:MAG: thiol:disulfide interchange protein DsbA/DsbL [Gammaproteobacteria bacterium]|nr:thiol:disulfide interchange protein DsbA/DsbL [Gammaproteobacteria bacterium]